MYIINNNFMCNVSPYAGFWSITLSSRPRLLADVNCPKCNKCHRSSIADLDKHVLDEGILPDMTYGDLIVSEKFRSAWLASGLKGIDDFLPMRLYQRRDKRHVPVKQPYYQVVVNVPHLKVDLLKSGLINDDDILVNNGDEAVVPEGKRCWIYWQCPVCGYTERSFSPYRDKRLEIYWPVPDHLVYDGTTDDDIFTFTNAYNGSKGGISGERFYFVSDRFISFVKENKLTNVYALPPEEFRMSLKGYTDQKFTPVYTDSSSPSQ